MYILLVLLSYYSYISSSCQCNSHNCLFSSMSLPKMLSRKILPIATKAKHRLFFSAKFKYLNSLHAVYKQCKTSVLINKICRAFFITLPLLSYTALLLFYELKAYEKLKDLSSSYSQIKQLYALNSAVNIMI